MMSEEGRDRARGRAEEAALELLWNMHVHGYMYVPGHGRPCMAMTHVHARVSFMSHVHVLMWTRALPKKPCVLLQYNFANPNYVL